MLQHNERCKRFCSYFYLNDQAAAQLGGEGGATWIPEGTCECACVCVCVGRVKSNCGGGCHGLKSTSVATGATVHVARLTECGCVCVCVSLYFSLFSRALCLSACIRVKLMCCKN